MIKQVRKNIKLKAFGLALMAMSTSTATAQSSSFVDENNAYFGPTLPTEDEKNFSGAYYTGDYQSPFKTYLGKTDEEIQAKLDQLWNHYFKGDNNSKVYYETSDGAYIEDINNRDVRSEGMSYGMMICVQTNHKEEFDKLWKWAKAHMWHNPSSGGDGYFSWSVNTNGSTKDKGCAPDGEIYFMMSLLLATNRWNDDSYMNDAQAILKACWKGNGNSLFNEQSYIVTFQPTAGNNSWSDPSYSLPAYVDLFSRWTTTNKDKWGKATKATRDHLYKSSNTKSGLFSDYNNFDGTPHSVSFNTNATKYMYDAMRCAMNFGMDYYLFGADAKRQTEMAKRIIDFFEKDGYKHARFNWDGSNPSESYTTGEKGCNAVACYALIGEDGYDEAIKKNLKMAWDEKLMTGQYRYYDGLVHYLSMLHLCGSFKIWKGKLVPPTAKTELVYTGAKQDLIVGGSGAEEGLIKYLVDGTSCGTDIPQGTDAKTYTVKWYASSTASPSLNTPDFSLTVTILPKTVSAPTITLSQTSYDFDGTAKTPTVTVKDGETEIPAGEYTVSYENNTKVGKAKVTITDKEGGNYTVNGSAEFEIKTAEGSVTAPTAKTDLVYNGGKQDLITAGSSATGTVQYSLDGTSYDTAIPQGQDAKEYTVYYKVVAKEGYKDVSPATVKVVISPKTVSAPTITLSQTSYDFDGTPKTPTVTVKDGETEIPAGEYTVGYENNTNVGKAKVTITDKEGGNYTVNGSTEFEIKAVSEPDPDPDPDPEPDPEKVVVIEGDAIGDNAFKDKTDVEVIVLPDTEEPITLGTNALKIDDSHMATVISPLALLDDYALNPELQEHVKAGKLKATVKPSTKLWTLACGVDVKVPAGVSVYKCRINNAGTKVDLLKLDPAVLGGILKANNGVLISGVAGQSYDIVVSPDNAITTISATDAKSYGDDNMMEPVIVATHFNTADYYLLWNNEFHQVDVTDPSKIPAGKAVLKKPGHIPGARTLVIGNVQTTGIAGVEADSEGTWYNLNGQRISEPTKKGLYIYNGKKVRK